MAHNLKLEVFRISLKKKGGSNSKLFVFKDFFEKAFLSVEKEEAYKQFVSKFLALFNDEFMLNADNTKAISATSESRFSISTEKNIIDCEVLGGNTGIEQKLYRRKNSKKVEGKILNDNVAALPFYVKIWTPLDHSTGILMIQSYSNHTVSNMVKIFLTKHFQEFDFSILVTPYVPIELKEEYKKNSSVYKVAFVKESLSKDKRKLINPLFANFEELKIRIEVSGFTEKVEEFWAKFTNTEKIISSNLEDFDIKENDDYKTVAFYRDEKGNKARTSIEKQIELKPTIFLDDSLKQQGSDIFDFDKIKTHTDGLLENIKKEIKYVPAES